MLKNVSQYQEMEPHVYLVSNSSIFIPKRELIASEWLYKYISKIGFLSKATGDNGGSTLGHGTTKGLADAGRSQLTRPYFQHTPVSTYKHTRGLHSKLKYVQFVLHGTV